MFSDVRDEVRRLQETSAWRLRRQQRKSCRWGGYPSSPVPRTELGHSKCMLWSRSVVWMFSGANEHNQRQHRASKEEDTGGHMSIVDAHIHALVCCYLPVSAVLAEKFPGSALCHETPLQNLKFSFSSNLIPAFRKAKTTLKLMALITPCQSGSVSPSFERHELPHPFPSWFSECNDFA